jgi:hypothetical protein
MNILHFSIAAVLAALVFSLTPLVYAQEAPKEAAKEIPYVPTPRTAVNTIYAELLGNALSYSLNYERMIQDNIGLRVGVSYFGLSVAPSQDKNLTTAVFSMPLMGMYFVGTEASRLELGLGTTVAFSSVKTVTNGSEDIASGVSAIITSTIAYRIQPPQGGFNFKIGATPYFAPATGTVMIWGGISAGFGF